MKDVYVLGSYTTPVKKWPDKSHKDLVRDAYLNVLKDAGLENGDLIESVWCGSAMMNSWGQNMIRGQVVFTPLIREGLLPERLPFYNVEGGCATGSLAFQGAWRDIQAGITHVSLAMGFEKVHIPHDKELQFSQFNSGIDQQNPEEWMAVYKKLADMTGTTFEVGPNRSMFMDTYGMQAPSDVLYFLFMRWCAERQNPGGAAGNCPDMRYADTSGRNGVFCSQGGG